MFIYAGIGSRKTPPIALQQMKTIGRELAATWHLRSGYADGADQAFFFGAMEGKGTATNFIPWEGFNGAPGNDERFVVGYSPEAMNIAKQFHPNWDACSSAVKLLHMRNVFQIAGLDLNTPVDMVVCWTKDGKRGGGTGQALRIAEYLKIPIFDIAVPIDQHRLINFVAEAEDNAKPNIMVVNRHHPNAPKGEYIGRGSPLGNPYSHLAGTSAAFQVDTRDEAISLYRDWLQGQISIKNPEIVGELDRLATIAMQRPLVLECYCKPAACHGDVIADVLTKAIMQHRKP